MKNQLKHLPRGVHASLVTKAQEACPEVMHAYTYTPNEVIVQEGVFVDSSQQSLLYASVPLGIIVRGNVSVHYHGKDLKRLSAGDFIGVFEVADALALQGNRHIGTWTLTAQEEVEILFFSEEILTHKATAMEQLRSYIRVLATEDPVPKPVTSLPLLDYIAAHTTKEKMANTAIVVHSHILPSMIPLIKHLAHLVGPELVYVIGKPYSTIPSAHNELAHMGVKIIPVHIGQGMSYEFASKEGVSMFWHILLEARIRDEFSNLLILDDGGDIFSTIPWEQVGDLRIAGTEQTQRGVTRLRDTALRLPTIVSVATCGVKKSIETVFIARAVVEKAREILKNTNKKIGVIGFGSVGQAIFDDLLEQNIPCQYYDVKNKTFDDGGIHTLDELLDGVDIVISTTGVDALRGVAFEKVSGIKTLISASSADLEFASLLQFQQVYTKDTFSDITVQVHDKLTITIVNGGYPMNFDRKREIEPAGVMVLTRALLYIGLLQAWSILQSKNGVSGFFNLDTLAQEKLFDVWFEQESEYADEFDIDEEKQEISKNLKEEFQNTSTIWSD